MTKAQAETKRREKQDELNRGGALRDKPRRTALAAFAEDYKARRAQGDSESRGFLRTAPKLSPATIAEHDMTLRYLKAHFGETRSIDAIDVNDADGFVNALAAGEIGWARSGKAWVQSLSIGEQTVRKHIRNAKAIFNWSRLMRLVRFNPFDQFDGRTLPGGENHFVTLADAEKLLSACDALCAAELAREYPDDRRTPDDAVRAKWAGWRVLIGLCRMAGLRLGESLALPWSGTATDKRGEVRTIGIDTVRWRVRIVAEKTRMYREIPIAPRMRQVLADLAEAFGADGATVCGLSVHNTTRIMGQLVKAAGLTRWPKLIQALRSSAENEWKAKGVAEATYAAWLGHSPTVSRRHYVSPTDSEFEAITNPETTLRAVGTRHAAAA